MKQWLFYSVHIMWITGCALCLLYDDGWVSFDHLLPLFIAISILGATLLNIKNNVSKGREERKLSALYAITQSPFWAGL